MCEAAAAFRGHSLWNPQTQKSVTNYIPLSDAPAMAATAEQRAKRRALAREARQAWRAALAAQLEKAKQRKRDRPIDS